MLTLSELKSRQAEPRKKRYDKQEMDEFLEEVYSNYKELYEQNNDLKKKVKTLSDGIQYYRSIETTLQQALILAEKTAKETKDAAILKAEAIEKEARMKAEKIINSTEQEYINIKQQCIHLVKQFDQYKLQLKQAASAQIELVESNTFNIYSPELNSLYREQLKEIETKGEKETKKTDEKSEEPKIEHPINQNIEQPIEQPLESKTEKPFELKSEQPLERKAEQSIEQSLEPKAEQLFELKPEQSIEQPLEHLEQNKEQPLESKAEQPIKQTVEQFKESPDESMSGSLFDSQKDLKREEEEELSFIKPPVPNASTIEPIEWTLNSTKNSAIILEPINSTPLEPLEAKVLDIKETIPLKPILFDDQNKPSIQKEEKQEQIKAEPQTLDTLLKDLNMSSSKNSTSKNDDSSENDPFDFLGSVEDF